MSMVFVIEGKQEAAETLGFEAMFLGAAAWRHSIPKACAQPVFSEAEYLMQIQKLSCHKAQVYYSLFPSPILQRAQLLP